MIKLSDSGVIRQHTLWIAVIGIDARSFTVGDYG
jgi:hypothetical protein